MKTKTEYYIEDMAKAAGITPQGIQYWISSGALVPALRGYRGRSCKHVFTRSQVTQAKKLAEKMNRRFHDKYYFRKTKRNNEILKLFRQGYSYREIGRKLGVSGQRVGQILRDYERRGRM